MATFVVIQDAQTLVREKESFLLNNAAKIRSTMREFGKGMASQRGIILSDNSKDSTH